MSEGAAFVIQALEEIAQHDRNARHQRPEPEKRRRGGLVTRSLIGVLLVVVAIMIVAFTVAASGISADQDAYTDSLTGAPVLPGPDSLTSCDVLDGRTGCLRETT
jgi:hypothetical protein